MKLVDKQVTRELIGPFLFGVAAFSSVFFAGSGKPRPISARDLQLRLSRLGLRVRSILSHTAVYQLWHPQHSTFARNGEGTANLRYYRRKFVPTYCQNGLDQDRPDTLVIEFSNRTLLFPRNAGLRKAA